MQKWSPEPFDARPVATAPPGAQERFAALDDAQRDEGARLFRRESGFTDTKSLMASLTRDERAQVYELVEMDLEADYREREAALTAEFETNLAAAKAEMAGIAAGWSERLAAAVAAELREAAAASARLAVEIAAKIARRALVDDPQALVRVIETTLFKVAGSRPLTIEAHPGEALWLEGQTALCERLNIGEIVADRRIEAGGCVIRCAGQEWDATVRSQLENLGEIVEEIVATAASRPVDLPGLDAVGAAPDAPADGSAPEDGHEPGLD